jgi:hypothetical protein
VVLGTTGLIGDTGIVVGSTGIIGLAGISVGGATGLQGVTGLDMAGPTGLRGITGSRGIDGPVVVNSLFTQRSLGTSLTYTLPGNTLSVDEQHLELVAWGVTTSNGSSTPITLTLGGSTIFNRSLSGTNGAPFSIRGVIIRIGATTQECIMSAISGSGEVWAQRASTSVNLASNQDIVISTTSSAAIIETLLVRRLRQV